MDVMHALADSDRVSDVQAIAITHSPMLLASMEPVFSPEKDSLSGVFELTDSGQKHEVRLSKDAWHRRGDASMWLRSIFGLAEARSPEAEEALTQANALMRGPTPDRSTFLRLYDTLQGRCQAMTPSGSTGAPGLGVTGCSRSPRNDAADDRARTVVLQDQGARTWRECPRPACGEPLPHKRLGRPLTLMKTVGGASVRRTIDDFPYWQDCLDDLHARRTTVSVHIIVFASSSVDTSHDPRNSSGEIQQQETPREAPARETPASAGEWVAMVAGIRLAA